jgi:hypothetical protein
MAIVRQVWGNLQVYRCGERRFAAAPSFDFLDLGENIPFPNHKTLLVLITGPG